MLPLITRDMTSIPSQTNDPSQADKPAGDTRQVQRVMSGTRAAGIPWGAYGAVYFIQAAIMAMVLMNVPVFLRQGLGLDWLGLTASYVVMFAPVLLRPVLAWAADRRPASLAAFLLLGIVLVIAGSAGASAGAYAGPGGIIPTTIGFAVAVVGATLLNVAADSHIVRAVPLALSAKVNSFRRIFAFLGIATGQICYILVVGSHFADFPRWTAYFAVPAVIAGAGYVLALVIRKGDVLPAVANLPPRRAPWLEAATQEGGRARDAPVVLGMTLAIAFLFTISDGLVETTFENFIVDSYGGTAWITYSGVMMLGGVIGVAGYVLAARSGKRAPEWAFLWYFPILIAYYTFLWAVPPFQGVLWATVALQVPAAFVQVRLFQSWQAHAYSRRPGLLFQFFMVTYQLGRIVGIGLSGGIMTTAGYAGIFAGAVAAWGVVLGFAVAYHIISKRQVKHSAVFRGDG